MIKDNTNDLEQSLLLEHPELKLIADPFVRFYTYRSKTEKEFSDRDRSNTAKNIYKKLNWYDESIDKDFLEPDTFFASSHNLIRNLFNKYDLVYYRDNFKSYCIANMIDYDKLTHYKARKIRYRWMIETEVMAHYEFITNNPSLSEYIESTHKIGNFMIIPKGFGWEMKCRNFKESPIKSLFEIEQNWNKYSNNYRYLKSFEAFKKLYLLEGVYLENDKLNMTIDIDFTNDSFSDIFEKMQVISELIEMRTYKIAKKLQSI